MAVRLFYGASLAFLLGVLADPFLSVDARAIFVGAIVSSFVAFIAARSNMRVLYPHVALALAAVPFLFVGALRHNLAETAPDATLSSLTGARVALVGTIVAEPDERSSGTLLTLGELSLGTDGAGPALSGKVLVRAAKFPAFAYGDRVSATGLLKLPEPFEGDGGRIVDYPALLSRRGIDFIVERPEVLFVSDGHGNPVLAALFSLKGALSDGANRFVPAPESALLGGVIFGSQEGMPADVSESFRRAGLVHIVVLSGYNLSVVADWVMRAAAFLPGPVGLSLGALAIALYAAMAGASATAVRAAIMALIVILARGVRRRYNPSRALTVAALAMVAANPKVLAFDRSFQLSFLATLAVVYVSPLVERRLYRVPEFLGLRGILASTIATQILVLPFLLHMSGSLSLTALPANLLALPAVPAAMLSGIVLSVGALIAPPLAIPLGLVATAFLAWVIRVGTFLGGESAAVTVPAFPFAWVIAAYAAIGFMVVRAYQKKGTETPNVDTRN